MRIPRVLVIGLTLAGLAGCGTAVAPEKEPAWVAAAPGLRVVVALRVRVGHGRLRGLRRFGGLAVGLRRSPTKASPSKESPIRKAQPWQASSAVRDQAGEASRAALRRARQQPDEDRRGRGRADLRRRARPGADAEAARPAEEAASRRRSAWSAQNVAAHPELVRRIAAEGHTLCNHTWQHSLTLGKQKPAVIRADLQRTNDAIRQAVPGARIKYMRAPGGNFTTHFVATAADLGMTSIYWQVDPRDWDHPGGETDAAHEAKVVSAVQKHVGKGAIVLSHDYRPAGHDHGLRAADPLAAGPLHELIDPAEPLTSHGASARLQAAGGGIRDGCSARAG